MSTDNWILPSGAPRCVFADTLYRTAKDTIFSKLRMDTTPGEFAAAQESLRLLREELERTCRPCTTAHSSAPIAA
jgi:hypothetical protein